MTLAEIKAAAVQARRKLYFTTGGRPCTHEVETLACHTLWLVERVEELAEALRIVLWLLPEGREGQIGEVARAALSRLEGDQ